MGKLAVNSVQLPVIFLSVEGEDILAAGIFSNYLQVYVSIPWKELEPVLKRAGLVEGEDSGGNASGVP